MQSATLDSTQRELADVRGSGERERLKMASTVFATLGAAIAVALGFTAKRLSYEARDCGRIAACYDLVAVQCDITAFSQLTAWTLLISAFVLGLPAAMAVSPSGGKTSSQCGRTLVVVLPVVLMFGAAIATLIFLWTGRSECRQSPAGRR
jgi:hypothetical protein